MSLLLTFSHLAIVFLLLTLKMLLPAGKDWIYIWYIWSNKLFTHRVKKSYFSTKISNNQVSYVFQFSTKYRFNTLRANPTK